MKQNELYEDLGVRTVINGCGNRTQVSGSLLRDGVLDAMRMASESYVHITDLEAAASRFISDITGAEAGLVTAGTAAGLVVGTAACIAGNNYKKMKCLPDTTDINSKVIIPKGHYNKYTRMFRAAGADLEEVGTVTYHPVNGGTDKVQKWEIDNAIDTETVAIVYTQKEHNILQLEHVIEVAHSYDVPVIVDAADELPPKKNLQRFINIGADLVAFAGGKAIRGPQSTGFIAGKKELIQSAAIQQLSDGYHPKLWEPPQDFIDSTEFPGAPPNGLARSMKVSKESIVGLMTALEGFLDENHENLTSEWEERSKLIATLLRDQECLKVLNEGANIIVKLEKLDVVDLIYKLRSEDPRIWVGEDRTHLNEFHISPKALTDEEAKYLCERIIAGVNEL